jgi:uncharacterized repeat protein (TIGR01451 family)
VNDSFTAPEGETLLGNVARNDTPGSEPVTYALVAGSGPASGSVDLGPDGTFLYTAEPGFVGTDSFAYQVCDTNGDCASASASITITPQPGKLQLQKLASSSESTAASLVAFTVTLVNVSGLPLHDAELFDQSPAGFSLVPGSVEIDDADGAGEVQGTGPFTITGIDIEVAGMATVRYFMRVGAGLPAGEYTNLATARQLGAAISNTASAKIRLRSGSDPDTEQARILGKVFDDRNGDGWQDEGERGIPGVRVVTVEGLVAQTDAYGRYHLEGLTLSNAVRGQNFVVKVDLATLPAGSVLTTENPLIRRVTEGLPVRFDFGFRLPSPGTRDSAGAAP